MLFSQMLHGDTPACAAAPVTRSGGGTVDATDSTDWFGAPLYAPYGVYGLPPEGTRALFLPLDGGYACIGALCAGGEGLAPGELRLSSAGGAAIVLKNNGEVWINGAVVAPDGTIAQAASGRDAT